jgi:hypothetical protein
MYGLVNSIFFLALPPFRQAILFCGESYVLDPPCLPPRGHWLIQDVVVMGAEVRGGDFISLIVPFSIPSSHHFTFTIYNIYHLQFQYRRHI